MNPAVLNKLGQDITQLLHKALLGQSEPRIVATGVDSRLVARATPPSGGATLDVEPPKVARATPQPGTLNIAQEDLDRLYTYMERRFIETCHTDPSLLALALAQSSVLEVTMMQPRRIEVDGASLRGRVARLLHDGWFDAARSTGGTRSELARTGADPGGGGNLSAILGELKREGFLMEIQSKYTRSPTMRVVLNKHVEVQ